MYNSPQCRWNSLTLPMHPFGLDLMPVWVIEQFGQDATFQLQFYLFIFLPSRDASSLHHFPLLHFIFTVNTLWGTLVVRQREWLRQSHIVRFHSRMGIWNWVSHFLTAILCTHTCALDTGIYFENLSTMITQGQNKVAVSKESLMLLKIANWFVFNLLQ